jgi:hypothetical protein
MSWVAQPLLLGAQGSMLGSAIGQGSMLDHLKDPVVALLGSMLFSNLGSMLSFQAGAPGLGRGDRRPAASRTATPAARGISTRRCWSWTPAG